MTCVKPAKLSRRVTKSQQKKIKKLFFFFLFLKYGTSFYFSSTEHHFISQVRNIILFFVRYGTPTAGAETKFFWKKAGLTAQTHRPQAQNY
jgi:hypothetical protein